MPTDLYALRFTLALALSGVAARAESADVVIYGATPAAIAAAISAAKAGHTVLLAEPTIRIGGGTTNGLSHPDFHAFEALTGTYLELTRRTLAYYSTKYGPDSQQAKDTFRGTHAEPKVNLLLFQQMLAEHPKIAVRTQWTLLEAKLRGAAGDRWICEVVFRDASGASHPWEGKIFIDGSYEGDLMAAAQVQYRIGCEGREEYNESLAPEEGNGDLQGYNFRLCMTQDPAIRVPPFKPDGYRREDFSGLLALIADGRIKQPFGDYYARDNVVKAQIPVLPNRKADVNDASSGVRLSLPGEHLLWPEGDATIRQQIYDHHVLWNLGLIYFMQTDAELPASFREAAHTWGLCRDEYVETNHIPPQIYVREARRMVGVRIYTQHDTQHAKGDARSVLHKDSIAIGEYGHSSHGTRHEGSRFGGKRLGQLSPSGVPPYQIPYGTMLPKDVRNLLVPVAVSASHVGFCALRLEPIWTSIGQAAGHAAHVALRQGAVSDVRKVDVAQLQRLLHVDGSATTYFSDVLPGHPDFAAAQWWALQGGFHGLAPMPVVPGQRGKRIEGQHFETYPDHAAQLDLALDPALAKRWTALATAAGVTAAALSRADGRITRGGWLRAAFRSIPATGASASRTN